VALRSISGLPRQAESGVRQGRIADIIILGYLPHEMQTPFLREQAQKLIAQIVVRRFRQLASISF